MTFDPYRLFFCNLLDYCGKDVGDIHCDLHEEMCQDIAAQCDNIITTLGKNSSPSGISCISKDFGKFMDKMSKTAKEENRNVDFCLLGFYEEISKISVALERLLGKGKKPRESDTEKIQKFKECFTYFKDNLDAEVVSERTLHRIIYEGKGECTKKQLKVMQYLLRKVFPYLIGENSAHSYSLFQDASMENILFCDFSSSQKVIMDNGGGTKLEEHFERLNNLKYSDYQQIGDELCKLYQQLVRLLRSGQLIIAPDNKKAKEKVEETETFLNSVDMHEEETETCERIMDIAELSSHALQFLDWLSLIAKDNDSYDLNTLSFVEEIITSFRKWAEKEEPKHAQEYMIVGRKENLFFDDKLSRGKILHILWTQKSIVSDLLFQRLGDRLTRLV